MSKSIVQKKKKSLTENSRIKTWEIPIRTKEDIVEQILVNRKIDAKSWKDFLRPDYQTGLYDPFLMMGMKEAVVRIMEAIKNEEIVGIFGDYDADGIPASALLFDVLEKHGLVVHTFIPKRSEGYGLSERGIDELIGKGVKLIITVDLGITGSKEVDYAFNKGVDVIVTDHHEPIDGLIPTKAKAIIDTKQKECKYPFKELSGTAVAFKLATALVSKTGKLDFDKLKWYLDLVAISTFCDVVPLVDENRVMAKFGLIVLDKTRRVGLRKMYEIAAIDPKNINPYVVGFMIGPRLNAPGRMGDCSDSLKLLLTKDEVEAKTVAERLERINFDRQTLLKKVLKEAQEQVIDDGLQNNKVILVSGEGWPEGIIGLVAGRLTEKYARPAIVVGIQDGVGRGSARSIDGFEMVEALNECRRHLIKYGGHAKAAGLTVESRKLEDLYDRLLKIAEKELNDEDLITRILCDMEIDLSEIDWVFFEKLSQLEPYGLGNPKPVFVSRNVQCKSVAKMGKSNEHLRMVLSDGKNDFRAVGFGLGEIAGKLSNIQFADVVYNLERDDWKSGKNLQLKLIDIKARD